MTRKPRKVRVLYCGDGPVEGAARYLTGILRFLKCDVTHLLPKEKLTPAHLDDRYDAILLSDYPSSSATTAVQNIIAEQCATGTGVAMIGGWASFTGLDGLWGGSVIESILPVTCVPGDDRKNIAGGLLVTRSASDPVVDSLDFKSPPIICGLNEIKARAGSRVLLEARPLIARGAGGKKPSMSLAKKRYPLLVTGRHGFGRTAAFATDLAPHWCGGLVDWGDSAIALPVKHGVTIEVGEIYVAFVANLMTWLASPHSRV